MVYLDTYFCLKTFKKHNLFFSRSPPRLNSSSSSSLVNNGGPDNEATIAEIACMLIEAGADVNKTDHDHFTPLVYGMLI
jgi:hypothetical protein